MPDSKNLKAALWYAKQGFSVIPCKEDKKPLIPWEVFQKERASEGQLREWWVKFPDANIGIITGALSNLTVVDLDSALGAASFLKHLPQGVICPTVKTPKGQHLYFRYREGIRNRARFLPDCDIRSEGGYVLAPTSSINGKGYSWVEGKSVKDTVIPELPEEISSIIINSFLTQGGDKVSPMPQENPSSTLGLSFDKGTRDDALFHVANCLVKGGMPEQEIQQLLMLIGSKICNPAFPEKEILDKVKSAFNRSDRAERNLTAEVKEWIMSSSGSFLSPDVAKELDLSSRVAKKNLSKILNKFCQHGFIEKSGEKHGSWRKIERSITEQCWWEAKGTPLPLRYPLGVELFAKVFSGNIILLEGQKSQGKSSFALEFCRLNYHLFPQKGLYQNIEMSDDELLERFESYGDILTLEQWRNAITIIKQDGQWWDKILPEGLNVIDYLIEYEKAYMIPDFIKKIHHNLKSGIALVLVQRDPRKEYPTGGRGVRDIPRLVLSLIKHRIKIEDVKSWHNVMGRNPSGVVRKYKQASWWKFIPVDEWDFAEDEKYEQFKGDKHEKD